MTDRIVIDGVGEQLAPPVAVPVQMFYYGNGPPTLTDVPPNSLYIDLASPNKTIYEAIEE